MCFSHWLFHPQYVLEKDLTSKFIGQLVLHHCSSTVSRPNNLPNLQRCKLQFKPGSHFKWEVDRQHICNSRVLCRHILHNLCKIGLEVNRSYNKQLLSYGRHRLTTEYIFAWRTAMASRKGRCGGYTLVKARAGIFKFYRIDNRFIEKVAKLKPQGQTSTISWSCR